MTPWGWWLRWRRRRHERPALVAWLEVVETWAKAREKAQWLTVRHELSLDLPRAQFREQLAELERQRAL